MPISRDMDQPTVSARDLHEFLEISTYFSTWIARMFDYGFEEGLDYLPSKFGRQHPSGTKHATDYLLTLDTAKEIAMIQRTERGQQARRYFIECERQLRQSPVPNPQHPTPAPQSPAPPKTLREALLLAAELEAERENLHAQVATMAPKAAYADQVLGSTSEWTTTTIAKELGMSAIALNALLHRLGVQYYTADRCWVLYAKHDSKGYTDTRTHTHMNSKGEVSTRIHTVWTERGRQFIHSFLGEQGTGIGERGLGNGELKTSTHSQIPNPKSLTPNPHSQK